MTRRPSDPSRSSAPPAAGRAVDLWEWHAAQLEQTIPTLVAEAEPWALNHAGRLLAYHRGATEPADVVQTAFMQLWRMLRGIRGAGMWIASQLPWTSSGPTVIAHTATAEPPPVPIEPQDGSAAERWRWHREWLARLLPRLTRELEPQAVALAMDLTPGLPRPLAQAAFKAAGDAFARRLGRVPSRPFSWLRRVIYNGTLDVLAPAGVEPLDDVEGGGPAVLTQGHVLCQIQWRDDVNRALDLLGARSRAVAVWALTDLAKLGIDVVQTALALVKQHRFGELLTEGRRFARAPHDGGKGVLKDTDVAAFALRRLVGYSLQETADLLREPTVYHADRAVRRALGHIRELDPDLPDRLDL